LNDVIDNAGESMDVDCPGTTVETNVICDSVQESLEKTDVQKDVMPDVESSLGQHAKEGNVSAAYIDVESSFETASKKKDHYGDTAVNSPS